MRDPPPSRAPAALWATPSLAAAIEQAAGAFARLDQALDNHPLHAAFLHRSRLEAVRRQAAVDGHGINPWHLAASLEGLRLRMDPALRIIDRGTIFDAARLACGHHQWITAPDFDQEGAVQQAEQHLAAAAQPSTLLTAATGMQSWLEQGGTRPPIRAALIRFWVRQGLLRRPLPLTGPRALAADAADRPADWVRIFLEALAEEARDYHQLLLNMERAWLAARSTMAGQRRTSRAPLAVDVLAAVPLISATTLARSIGMSIKSAGALLDRCVAESIAVEVTHRSARRLFGLAGLAPLRDEVAPPRRPEPGRRPGRPRLATDADNAEPPPVLPPLPARVELPAIDYAALDAAMAHCTQLIRSTKHVLDRLARGDLPPADDDFG
jgi:hypothetical protein